METKWNLEKYFYKSIDDPQVDIDVEKFIEYTKVNVIEKYKDKLRNLKTKEEWSKYFETVQENEVYTKLNNIFMYLHLKSSLDTQNQELIKKIGQISNKIRPIQEELVFIDVEYRAIGEEKLLELSKDPNLEEFSKVFKDKAYNFKHDLDPIIEKALVSISRANVASCNNQLYEELKNSFMFEMINENGDTKEITEEELMGYMFKDNRELRERAAKVLREKYSHKNHQIVFGNVYSSIVKESVSNIKLRNYNSVMSPRNLAEDFEDESINLLLNEVKNRIYPLYKRYLELKKKILKVDQLRTWDLYAPVAKTKKEFEFDKGVQLFLDEIKKVDDEMYNFSKEMFNQSRVDVYPNEGKRGGAFCSYLKNIDSFVLLNYNKTLNDVSTIAHELGHAYHGFKLQSQPDRYYEAGLCMAETASVFNELLLSHKLLEQLGEDEKDEQLYLMDEELSGFFGTIARQIMYTSFEKRVHESFFEGNDLTYEDFNVMFREEQENLFQGVIEFDTPKKEDVGWSRIPHIHHLPFYCYSYAFGQILSISLYQMYLNEGDSFIPKYKKILQAGCSKTPKEILLEVGIDIDSSKFYENAEQFIKSKIDEFEELVNKL